MEVTESNLQKYSSKVKQTAEKLLKEKQVVETLSKYGTVFVGGSYALDVMYGPDIDIIVGCSDPKKAARSALADLVEKEGFQKYQYKDFVKYKLENRPESYILVLIILFEGIQWEIEIWFFDTGGLEEGREHINTLLSKLTPKIKQTIIKIKYQREQNQLSKNSLSSVTIYECVINNNACDIKDFNL